jgi:hypothetical protein
VLAHDEINQLLHQSIHTARAGRLREARAVLRALVHQAPNDWRVWWWTARYAATPKERVWALCQTIYQSSLRWVFQAVVGLFPFGMRGIRRLWAVLKAILTSPAHRQARHVIIFSTLALTSVFLIVWGVSQLLLPSASPPTWRVSALFERHTPTPIPPSPTPTPTLPLPRPTPTLFPIGRFIEPHGWHATVLRPSHTHVLSGSIGTVQPHNRFVLVLLAVANTAPNPRRLPPGLFTLSDAAGNRYAPDLNASAAYVETYGRGKAGDLTLQEVVPPGGGIYTLPLIFDVPHGAEELLVTVAGMEEVGWPCLWQPTPTPLPTATPTPSPLPTATPTPSPIAAVPATGENN